MDGIAWAGSAMVAARTRLEIAAENLANVSTDGFARVLARGTLGAAGVSITRATESSHGALRATGRADDLAIVGDGAFRVRDAHGHVSSTRAGAFTRDAGGGLRDDAGGVLLGAGGPLHVPQDASIGADGTVRSGGRVVDRLSLPPGSSVHAGFLESSATNAIAEMIDVVAAQRSFESAEKVVAAIDGASRKAADAARVH